jgi:hypothetical protein
MSLTFEAVLQHARPETAGWVAGADAATVALALDLGARFVLVAGERLGAAPVGSAEKGARGEAEVYELVRRGHGPVRDVSHRAHGADFVCDTRAGPVLVEVKHYASSVPSSEVEKFLRDLREKDAAAGVFLSLTSPIVGRKMALEVVLEPRVATGTLVPVVYAAAVRDGRLAPEVVLAAVSVATYLAEVYPRGTAGLRGRDTMLAYAVAADQIAEGVASCRGDLEVLAQSLGADCAALAARLQALGRESRVLARAQRSEVEDFRDVDAGAPGEFLAALRLRYPVAAADRELGRVVDALSRRDDRPRVAKTAAGEWRQLKTQMTHVPTGVVFSFTQSATVVAVPLAAVPAADVAGVIGRHPKKVRLSAGEFGVQLDEGTLPDLLGLVRHVAGPQLAE